MLFTSPVVKRQQYKQKYKNRQAISNRKRKEICPKTSNKDNRKMSITSYTIHTFSRITIVNSEHVLNCWGENSTKKPTRDSFF